MIAVFQIHIKKSPHEYYLLGSRKTGIVDKALAYR